MRAIALERWGGPTTSGSRYTCSHGTGLSTRLLPSPSGAASGPLRAHQRARIRRPVRSGWNQIAGRTEDRGNPRSRFTTLVCVVRAVGRRWIPACRIRRQKIQTPTPRRQSGRQPTREADAGSAPLRQTQTAAAIASTASRGGPARGESRATCRIKPNAKARGVRLSPDLSGPPEGGHHYGAKLGGQSSDN